MVDIDETVLDNSPAQAKSIKNRLPFNLKDWYAWGEMRKAKAIPGAVDFLNYAVSKGVKVFFVSNRDEVQKQATIDNLTGVGFKDISQNNVILRSNDSSKESRRQFILSKYRIVLFMGDNLDDHSNVFEKRSVADRFAEVDKAREMAHGKQKDRILRLVSSLLATFFLFIIVSNLMAILPLPVINRPPTSHFSVTLALALCAVFGTLLISTVVKGGGKTLMHLVWPNPLQWVSELTDIMSLSLRLFGNIAGEYMTVALVLLVVPWGIPLILHALGLIPAFVQALVFTLLTASFLANAIHVADEESAVAEPAGEASGERPVPATSGPMPAEGRS